MLRKVLVANRGEIAIRILRACQEMGIATVAVYAEDDRQSKHVRLADEAYLLPGSQLSETYLNIPALVEIAKKSGAEGIHPGYGFLSENAAFSQACRENGIVFIGPSPEVIEAMGSKLLARERMQNAGVPITPGSPRLSTLEEAQHWAEKIGYPLLLKASAGGGGRGMKRVMNAEELPEAYAAAMRESKSYFADDTVYLEKLVTRPRHIEVQILADTHGHVIHLGERDCSVQRRNQKLIEETPAPHLPAEVRQVVLNAAVAGAKAIGYTGAGTFEFVVQNSQDAYFMEVNTRLQVEHPITEMVTRVDLVKEQLRIASGLPLSYSQDQIHFEGHAIECRITVEDSRQNFRPVPGLISLYEEPAGFGVRVDSMPYSGYDIPRSYDSLLAKLVTWAPSREEALARMQRALKEYRIEGVTTLIPFFQWALNMPAFAEGHYDTSFVPSYFEPGLLPEAAPSAAPEEPPARQREVVDVEVNGRYFQVALYLPEAGAKTVTATPSGQTARPAGAKSNRKDSNQAQIPAPMAGTVVKVAVQAGQTVESGQLLCIIESMKMENDILSPRSGTLKNVAIAAGDKVQAGGVLMEFEPA
ncbi:carbamoyl phosphate synthase [bacterium (Candidatus Blackallbacteria) CG17_big_fil_post_rev_8_21_14_2_50_48_46]|uniref:Carbamoyl phosphate synthase n=1 Tax=bacterium (Candidatus Blackallbacteria) CG17_big_fil_post_rev_8_21_14_2_50_48_46 TaxID=2014261 RepID=A0A2M7G0M8_9BACT|nr:MAG: carbamoyl phosphate synthase [bacterium (Candidatus Blackallbacteria) CG18_big_fil_WC_8_21_14_2_50_49_26]PIW15229.1 MAG: carbamoyl phosphate synthase [bacterium (Candidatus Blackallbacteria) CG17_big_fil_post_rev_8_21_14_2_50_48_46]PIW44816.1 MAG: carbamoyl phosphate synthase [bacterium (Candidatus Blackallbacteria) CG13_big_fil_rev_8_21_14_2_50_49_14]